MIKKILNKKLNKYIQLTNKFSLKVFVNNRNHITISYIYWSQNLFNTGVSSFLFNNNFTWVN